MIYAWITQVGQQWMAHYTAILSRAPATWIFNTEQEAIDWIMTEAGQLMAEVEWVGV